MIDLDKILNIRKSSVRPTRGRVLISNPFLSDYFFRRAIVLLVDHGEDGSFGVIVNKPLDFRVNDVTRSFPASTSPVFLGGPVKTEGLFYIHTLGDLIPDSLQVMKGLWWGGELKVLEEIIAADPEGASESVRFYLGYSGWVTDQLKGEIQSRSWAIANVNTNEIMAGSTNNMWEEKVKELGKSYDPWLKLPVDPSFN